MSRQDFLFSVRDTILEALRVAPAVDESIAREKANNLAQVLFACFDIQPLPADDTPHGYELAIPRPDPNTEDDGGLIR